VGRPYNGHESWNAWNVSLWIGNDERLYRLAMHCLEEPIKGKAPSLDCAVCRFFRNGPAEGSRTPDGARYSRHSVKLALAGLRE